MENNDGRELKWDDPIENDGSGFTLLTPGEYEFTVRGFERKRFAGSAKLPPCNQAVLTLDIDGTTIESSLFLHSKTEGLLCQFFRSIGARKHGERIVMDWGKVTGATGRCKIGHRKWTGTKDNKEHTSNQVERFLDPPEGDAAPAPVAPAAAADEIPF